MLSNSHYLFKRSALNTPINLTLFYYTGLSFDPLDINAVFNRLCEERRGKMASETSSITSLHDLNYSGIEHQRQQEQQL